MDKDHPLRHEWESDWPLDLHPERFSNLSSQEQEHVLDIFRNLKAKGLKIGPNAETRLAPVERVRAGSKLVNSSLLKDAIYSAGFRTISTEGGSAGNAGQFTDSLAAQCRSSLSTRRAGRNDRKRATARTLGLPADCLRHTAHVRETADCRHS